ncbi:TPA: proline--tRNA ligase [Candidatus Woesearchaeota archaeon]|nr:proline--tRNA ligase [Candidatus Woesearchaeota archaeon]
MAKEMTRGITVKKEEDIAEWYQQLCLKSEVADFAPVKGCYILRPLGYSLWEGIQAYFNKRMKARGVQNAYFPLFIPESFFYKEAEHAKGFKPEVAWIANTEEGAERLGLRPTSETIMYDSYSRWLRSWRDLPIRINQWANVVRWETEATKLFLRSREFLWQEGHCVYETKEDCDREVKLFLLEYKEMCEELLAMPVIAGTKTVKEKFAGALYTMSIEGLMPDGKALQCGTSHNLGQGFAKSFNLSFQDKDGEPKTPWQSSWGVSTRLIGGMIMTHSDNKGLVLPPRIAPNKVAIVPILFDASKERVLAACSKAKELLHEYSPILDDREDYSPGWKFNEYELKGVPLRIEIGPKDVDAGQAVVVRRDTGEKEFVKVDDLGRIVPEMLEQMHKDMLEKAEKFMELNTVTADNWDDFIRLSKEGKLVKIPFCGEVECEELIKDKTQGVSSRNIPLEGSETKPGTKCLHCGKDARHFTFFSRSY